MQKLNLSRLIGLIIGMSLILACSVAAATDSGQGPINTIISPAIIGTGIVKENIQKFSESENEGITYLGKKEFPLGVMYEVGTDAGDRYYINANTGDIEVAVIRNAIPLKSMSTNDIGNLIDPVQKFAEKNYRNFTAKKMTLADAKIIDHGDAGKEYVFYWNEMSGEAYTLSSVMVSVYPDMNNTITYVAFDRPLLIGTTPKITRDDAESSAMRTFDMAAAAKPTSKLLVIPYGNSQKLVWLVDIVEKGNEEGFSHGGSVTVDAISGEVISIYPAL